ncbi:MAG: hypothetical protein ACO29U_03300 [Crocinitomicaceae bacterium]
MELINLIFRLGVLFAIYGFLWFFIDMGLKILLGSRKRSLGEVYVIKTIKYLFLVNVTFLFCLQQLNEPEYHVNYMHVAPSFVVLMVYFLGKLQQNEQRIQLMSSFTQGMKDVPFNRRWEISLIVLSALTFVGLVSYPQFSENAIAKWFQGSIIDIEETVIIGFIFKIIGFFFLIGLFFKMLNALNFIVSGKPMVNVRTGFGSKKASNEDSFDDYEEIDDNKLSE